MNPLLRQDEFGWRALPVVDEEDNKSRDQQDGNDDGCQDCTFGHDLVSSVRALIEAGRAMNRTTTNQIACWTDAQDLVQSNGTLR